MWHLEEWVSLSLGAGMSVIRSSKLELLSGWGGQSKASSGREGMRCPLLGETGPSLGGERFARRLVAWECEKSVLLDLLSSPGVLMEWMVQS